MKKSLLETFIKKYNLNGNINGARWKIDTNEKTLVSSGISDDQQILFDVTLSDFTELQDIEFGVYNTSRLKQMMGVLGEDIDLSLNYNSKNNKLNSISLKDTETEMRYVTADLAVIAEKPPLKVKPVYNAEIIFNEAYITKFIKAKNALNDVDVFTLLMNRKDKLELVIGYSSVNSNKITLDVATANGNDSVANPIHFNAKYLKEILMSNSECDTATLYVSDIGLAKISFTKDNFVSNYYLIEIKNVE
jgi:hypothetical protein